MAAGVTAKLPGWTVEEMQPSDEDLKKTIARLGVSVTGEVRELIGIVEAHTCYRGIVNLRLEDKYSSPKEKLWLERMRKTHFFALYNKESILCGVCATQGGAITAHAIAQGIELTKKDFQDCLINQYVLKPRAQDPFPSDLVEALVDDC